MWLKEFSNALTSELKFATNSLENFCDITDFDFLEEVLNTSLSQIHKEINSSLSSVSSLKMEKFRVKPDEILTKHFCDCCWIQCPFCHAICTNSMMAHTGVEHSVPFHRPYGINGWHRKDTIELCTDFCTSSVASDNAFYPKFDSEETVPFKKYRDGGPKYANWSITPDGSELPYWKWFVCKFQEQLENHYSKKFQCSGEIPSQWRSITKEEAIASLADMFL
ncbi:interferon-induced very large GTPase 1 [Aplochiton taeniatus]